MIPVFCGNSVSTTTGGEPGRPRAASSDALPVRRRIREDESVIESLRDDVHWGNGVTVSGGSCRRVRFCGSKTPAPERTKRKLPKSPILQGSLAAPRQNERSGSCRRVRFCRGSLAAPRQNERSGSCRRVRFCRGSLAAPRQNERSGSCRRVRFCRGSLAAPRQNERSGSCRRVRFCRDAFGSRTLAWVGVAGAANRAHLGQPGPVLPGKWWCLVPPTPALPHGWGGRNGSVRPG